MTKMAVLIFVIVSSAFSQSRFDKDAAKGLASITVNDLRSHLMFLASDELEGRETGYRGQKVAAQYIAAAFRKLGLKPAAAGQSYFQPFELDVIRPDPASTVTITSTRGSSKYKFGQDWFTTAARDTTITAQAVFVGLMDSPLTPEQETGLNDRIVIVIGAQRTEGTTPVRQRRGGGRQYRGAAAVVVISDETASGTIPDQVRAMSNALEKGSMSLKGSPRRGRGQLTLSASGSLGAALLAELGPLADVRARATRDTTFTPVVLNQPAVTIDLRSIHEIKTSENVAAILEGSDPVLKNEYVVLTAHYDHVGINTATGDIYNGADDDGSGTSMVLELAEAFVTNPVKPRRSLIFMTVAGEEKGLLGSSYYTQNPLVPLEKTMANINMDMIGRIDKKHSGPEQAPYVYVIGSDKISTELDSVLQVANKQTSNLALDYEYNDDNDPNQFYRRSDHYNFARHGIPIVFFFTGVHEDYHRPTDTVEKIEFERMVHIGQLAFATTWKTANFKRMFVKNGKPSAYSGGQ